VYLACFHLQWVLDQGPACEEVSADQAGQSASAGCSERMRLAEGQGSLGREEEGRKEACRSRAAERIHPYHRSQEQRRGYQGIREVLQDLRNEPVAGIAAAAGQEGSRREEEGMAAVAGHGIEAVAGWEPAGGVAAAVAAAGQGV
jgi:hypothetical protein